MSTDVPIMSKEEVERLIKKSQIITDADRIQAFKDLKITITESIFAQETQNTIFNRILSKINRNTTRTKIGLILNSVMLFLILIIATWLWIKPLGATKQTQERVEKKLDKVIQKDTMK